MNVPTAFRPWSLYLLAVLAFGVSPAAAQSVSLTAADADVAAVPEGHVLVLLQFPAWAGGRSLDVTYGARAERVRLDADGHGALLLPETDTGTLAVFYAPELHRGTFYRRPLCSFPAEELAAGVVEVTYVAGAAAPGESYGRFAQWPAVTWDAINTAAPGALLDVVVNGRAVGSTSLTRALRPGKAHRCVWRSADGTAACAADIELEGGLRRTYVCDVAAGVVRVQ